MTPAQSMVMMTTPKIAELRRSAISLGSCKMCSFIGRHGGDFLGAA
jgi:hypothetical protein